MAAGEAKLNIFLAGAISGEEKFADRKLCRACLGLGVVWRWYLRCIDLLGAETGRVSVRFFQSTPAAMVPNSLSTRGPEMCRASRRTHLVLSVGSRMSFSCGRPASRQHAASSGESGEEWGHEAQYFPRHARLVRGPAPQAFFCPFLRNPQALHLAFCLVLADPWARGRNQAPGPLVVVTWRGGGLMQVVWALADGPSFCGTEHPTEVAVRL